ncbi:MAG: bifunctional enoyl-CoA hydratase/phosphate acetyltransferase [Lachnospiraceae bacterium]|jgi:phosphate butyryltransferase|nr:bifunctional enoyl-CoA hydratase/phosphate acetyltransferase [Lachnospiraceae bacterium]
MDFESIIEGMRPREKSVLAVAAAEDDVVLGAVCQAADMGIVTPILCGNKDSIKAIAGEGGFDISGFEIVHCEDPISAAKTAVQLVKEKKADILMKGLVQTADLLRAVLNKENGLRTDSVLSHTAILHAPSLGRPIILTDAAIIPYPDLPTKINMIKNAVKAALGIGIENPKVAILAAVEVVNPAMPATLDAAALALMNRRGQLKDCIVDGPLAFDLALSEEAVRHKKVVSEVAGKADILLLHNIEAANSTLKAFTVVAGALFGGIVMGAAAPIVLTSRSDSEQSKLYSIACAASIANQ